MCDSLVTKLSNAEKSSAPSSDDHDFKLIEAQRVSRFLEDKLTRLIRDKETVDARVMELQTEVERLRAEVVTMDMVIAKQKNKLVEQKIAAESAHPESVDRASARSPILSGDDVSASGELVESLSACLSMARTSRKVTEEKIAALTSELADKENQVQDYKAQLESQKATEEQKIAALTLEITEKENQAQDFKAKLDSEIAKTEELTEQVALLEESSRKQAQGEETAETTTSNRSKPVGKVSKVDTMGFVCVPVRRVEGRPGSGPLYFL